MHYLCLKGQSFRSKSTDISNKHMTKNSRHEFKYIIDAHMMPIFEEYLQKIGLDKDTAQDGSYIVTSLYFDTPLLDDYHDKLSGVKFRRKMRARIYENSFSYGGDVWLEIKEKHNMNIRKIRSVVDGDGFASLLHNTDVAALKSRNGNDAQLRKFLHYFQMKNYHPNIVVRYKRSAYVSYFLSEIRLTIDYDIETCAWSDFVDNGGMFSVAPGRAVMEVKFFGAMPWWFGDMVRRFHLSREPFSKYTNAIDALTAAYPIGR